MHISIIINGTAVFIMSVIIQIVWMEYGSCMAPAWLPYGWSMVSVWGMHEAEHQQNINKGEKQTYARCGTLTMAKKTYLRQMV
jgi:hypothetical protein